MRPEGSPLVGYPLILKQASSNKKSVPTVGLYKFQNAGSRRGEITLKPMFPQAIALRALPHGKFACKGISCTLVTLFVGSQVTDPASASRGYS